MDAFFSEFKSSSKLVMVAERINEVKADTRDVRETNREKHSRSRVQEQRKLVRQ